MANNIKFAVAFNYKKNGCDIKDKKILIDSKGTDVYLNEFTVQYSIGFWIQKQSPAPGTHTSGSSSYKYI